MVRFVSSRRKAEFTLSVSKKTEITSKAIEREHKVRDRFFCVKVPEVLDILRPDWEPRGWITVIIRLDAYMLRRGTESYTVPTFFVESIGFGRVILVDAARVVREAIFVMLAPSAAVVIEVIELDAR